MQLQETRRLAAIVVSALFLLILCDTAAAKPPVKGGLSISIRSGGPPAHAPAHGYRRQHICGFQLVFDVGLGLYVAVGATDVYYHEGHFYRCRNGVWEISLRAVTWEPVVIEKMPSGLQIKAKSMIKLNGNGNSLVKLNGNGNSLVKLNGNDNGPNGNAAAGGNNAKTPANTGDSKAIAAAGATAAKSTGVADAKAGSGNTVQAKTTTNTNAAVTKPEGGGATSAAKGKKK